MTLETAIRKLARSLKAANVDYDSALTISLQLKTPDNMEKMCTWLEQNKTAGISEICDRAWAITGH